MGSADGPGWVVEAEADDPGVEPISECGAPC